MSSAAAPSPNLHFGIDSPVNGLAVAERRVGDGEATIICVHGGLDRGGSFGRLARRTGSFSVIAYDRRGYQGSRDLRPLDLTHHIDDLLALARHEAKHGPVILFGHSFGGVVALGAALADPGLAQLVVAYESPLPWILAREGSTPVPANESDAEVEAFFRRVVSHSAWERLSESERESRRLDGPGLLSDLRVLGDQPPFDIRSLSAATTYVYGDGDRTEYYRRLCRELARLNPIIQSRQLLKAGHGAHLSSPDQLADLIHELWRQRCALA